MLWQIIISDSYFNGYLEPIYLFNEWNRYEVQTSAVFQGEEVHSNYDSERT